MQAFAFAGVLAAATFVAVEIGAFALLEFGDRWPSREEIQPTLSGDPANPEVDALPEHAPSPGKQLHPYLGFVRTPGEARRVNLRKLGANANEFGFLGVSPLDANPTNAARVAITGGSVAEELYLYGRHTLEDELEKLGAFGARKVEVISLAAAGFKQPQQLLALNYMLVMGARLDVVVNLDGFNEVVLPFTDNRLLGLSPSYPFRWQSVAASGIDPELAVPMAAIRHSEDALERWRERLEPFRQSSFALVAWHIVRQRNATARAQIEAELRERLGKPSKLGPADRGPRFDYDAGARVFDEFVAIWSRSSIQMWQVAEGHGIEYLHFLQPNQYVAGSKPWSPRERRVALPERNSTRVGAEMGYPLLIAEGERLRESGVPFSDLTPIFSQETETVYRDACCHYRRNGYELIAARVAHEIAEAISTR